MPANAVQNKINDLLWFGETLVAENGMGDRKSNRTQCAGRLCDIQPELVLVRLDQRGDHLVEELVTGLLLGPEAVVIMRLPPKPQRSEQCDNPAQSLLEDDYRCNEPFLKAQARIDPGELIAGALAVKSILDNGIDQGLFRGKRPEDGPLGDAGSLCDLPGTDLPAESLQQRLRGCNERGSALIER